MIRLASGLGLGMVLWVTGLLCTPHPYRLTEWLPDSLTTWEIHGVSLSKSKGEVGPSDFFSFPLTLLSPLLPAWG